MKPGRNLTRRAVLLLMLLLAAAFLLALQLTSATHSRSIAFNWTKPWRFSKTQMQAARYEIENISHTNVTITVWHIGPLVVVRFKPLHVSQFER